MNIRNGNEFLQLNQLA